MQQRFADPQMRSLANRKKFSQPFDNSQENGQQIFVHGFGFVKALKKIRGLDC